MVVGFFVVLGTLAFTRSGEQNVLWSGGIGRCGVDIIVFLFVHET